MPVRGSAGDEGSPGGGPEGGARAVSSFTSGGGEGSVPWAAAWPGPDFVYFGHDARRRLQVSPFAREARNCVDTCGAIVPCGLNDVFRAPGKRLGQWKGAAGSAEQHGLFTGGSRLCGTCAPARLAACQRIGWPPCGDKALVAHPPSPPRGASFSVHHPPAQLEPHAAGLDTGCVYGGALTAAVLPGGRLVAVPAREAYAAIKR